MFKGQLLTYVMCMTYTKYMNCTENRCSRKFCVINLLKPAGQVMRQQFNIQQLHALPTLYLCVLYLPENKQRLVPLTA